MTDAEKEVVLNKISEKLEQGWVLLQNPCPSCNYPLIKHKDQGTFCAKEGAFIISEEEAKARNLNSKMDEPDSLEAELQDNKFGDLGDDFEDHYAKRLEHVDRASAAIGEHLLKGWTMLADACRSCGSPLMALRDGPKTCVVCKHEPAKSAKKIEEPASTETKSALKEPIKTQEVKRAPEKEKVEIRSKPVQMASFDQMLLEEEQDKALKQKAEEALRAQALGETRLSAKPLVPRASTQDVIPTLVLKLEFLREQMHATADIATITNLAIAMKEVANAIAACKQINAESDYSR